MYEDLQWLLLFQGNKTEDQELKDRVKRLEDEKYYNLRQTLPEHLTERRENLERRLVIRNTPPYLPHTPLNTAHASSHPIDYILYLRCPGK